MVKEKYFQTKVIEWLDNIESGVMIPVYGHKLISGSDLVIQSYIVPKNSDEKELENDEPWHGSLEPGFTQYGFGDSCELLYLRFGNEDGVEPLIVEYEYDGLKDSSIELVEEFRQLFTLYYNRNSSQYICPQDDDRLVCSLNPDYVTIDKKYLKSYLAAKEKVLAICINGQIQESVGTTEKYNDVQSPIEIRNTVGSVNIGNHNGKNYSYLFAKKIIDGCPLSQCNLWPFTENHEYLDFIIGTDENGNEVMHSCDPNTLSNYFGSNPGEPHYLTPVYFDRTVLEKYIRQPERYSVEPGVDL